MSQPDQPTALPTVEDFKDFMSRCRDLVAAIPGIGTAYTSCSAGAAGVSFRTMLFDGPEPTSYSAPDPETLVQILKEAVSPAGKIAALHAKSEAALREASELEGRAG